MRIKNGSAIPILVGARIPSTTTTSSSTVVVAARLLGLEVAIQIKGSQFAGERLRQQVEEQMADEVLQEVAPSLEELRRNEDDVEVEEKADEQAVKEGGVGAVVRLRGGDHHQSTTTIFTSITSPTEHLLQLLKSTSIAGSDLLELLSTVAAVAQSSGGDVQLQTVGVGGGQFGAGTATAAHHALLRGLFQAEATAVQKRITA